MQKLAQLHITASQHQFTTLHHHHHYHHHHTALRLHRISISHNHHFCHVPFAGLTSSKMKSCSYGAVNLDVFRSG